MSIQEAFEGRLPSPDRNFLSSSEVYTKIGEETSKIARDIFENSGMRRTLDDLIDFKKPEKPDIKYEEKEITLQNDVLSWIVGMDYKDIPERPGEYAYNAIIVGVVPATREIIVQQQGISEILSEGQLKRITVVEDAVRAAYDSPSRYSGPAFYNTL